ncbi:syntaxin-132 [Anaeramoeba ignava]|uniref:Syntaxin-132 n=1 Tax=Anaeramoeba ignava TaxID=1746090 RepID=A0A9Q0RD68_ANAIG|nr:syntaxin-132 [Anaeramoeba ignava]
MQDRFNKRNSNKNDDEIKLKILDDPSQNFEDKIEDYFSQVKLVEESISAIETQTKLFEKTQLNSINSTKSSESKHYAQKSSIIVQEIYQKAKIVKKTLQEMDNLNNLYIQKNGQITEARIRKNQHQALVKNFMDAMKNFQQLQQKYQTKFKEELSRRYKIVDPNISETQIEDYIENQDGSQIFSVVDTQAYQEARSVLEEIEIKHSEIINLEKSVNEIHQLFVDMATLVEFQGKNIDNIENNVIQSADYIEQGVEQLQKARVYQKKSRKKLCFIICLILTVLIIISISFGVVFGK